MEKMVDTDSFTVLAAKFVNHGSRKLSDEAKIEKEFMKPSEAVENKHIK